jgi:hypothetical protein
MTLEEKAHYWNPVLYQVFGALSSALYRILGKSVFVECRTQRNNTLGNDKV